jgi:hypothetical protein
VLNTQPEYRGPLWLKRLLGKNLLAPAFLRVESADLQVAGDDQFKQAVSRLKDFAYLRELRITTSDKNPPIRYSELAELKALRYLTLENVLSEDDVSELAMLRQLVEIDLTAWRWQKPEIMLELMGALPNCRFSEYPIEYPANYDANDRYTY